MYVLSSYACAKYNLQMPLIFFIIDNDIASWQNCNLIPKSLIINDQTLFGSFISPNVLVLMHILCVKINTLCLCIWNISNDLISFQELVAIIYDNNDTIINKNGRVAVYIYI